MRRDDFQREKKKKKKKKYPCNNNSKRRGTPKQWGEVLMDATSQEEDKWAYLCKLSRGK